MPNDNADRPRLGPYDRTTFLRPLSRLSFPLRDLNRITRGVFNAVAMAISPVVALVCYVIPPHLPPAVEAGAPCAATVSATTHVSCRHLAEFVPCAQLAPGGQARWRNYSLLFMQLICLQVTVGDYLFGLPNTCTTVVHTIDQASMSPGKGDPCQFLAILPEIKLSPIQLKV